MEDLITAARRLVTYMSDNEVGIMSKEWMAGNDDTDVFDKCQTAMLKSLTRELKEVVNNNQPMPAQHLIRRCFTKANQTDLYT